MTRLILASNRKKRWRGKGGIFFGGTVEREEGGGGLVRRFSAAAVGCSSIYSHIQTVHQRLQARRASSFTCAPHQHCRFHLPPAPTALQSTLPFLTNGYCPVLRCALRSLFNVDADDGRGLVGQIRLALGWTTAWADVRKPKEASGRSLAIPKLITNDCLLATAKPSKDTRTEQKHSHARGNIKGILRAS
jgi:hypothetical protein